MTLSKLRQDHVVNGIGFLQLGNGLSLNAFKTVFENRGIVGADARGTFLRESGASQEIFTSELCADNLDLSTLFDCCVRRSESIFDLRDPALSCEHALDE